MKDEKKDEEQYGWLSGFIRIEVILFFLIVATNYADSWWCKIPLNFRGKSEDLRMRKFLGIILGGLRRWIQPLDNSVNNRLKWPLKTNYFNSLIDQKRLNTKVKIRKIIIFIYQVCWNINLTLKQIL